jgi:predicted ATPase
VSVISPITSLPPKRIVVTGGPGAGKTAVLEIARRELGAGIEILPEAASIVFGGGFPRRSDMPSKCAAQRTIYHVQDQLERMTMERGQSTAVLCDRGTIDGLAYWPGRWEDFFAELGTSVERELARYAAVVHLRVPDATNGYHSSSVRIESVREAQEIDARLLEVWSHHPCRVVIDTHADFFRKAKRAVDELRRLAEVG